MELEGAQQALGTAHGNKKRGHYVVLIALQCAGRCCATRCCAVCTMCTVPNNNMATLPLLDAERTQQVYAVCVWHLHQLV